MPAPPTRETPTSMSAHVVMVIAQKPWKLAGKLKLAQFALSGVLGLQRVFMSRRSIRAQPNTFETVYITWSLDCPI